MNRAVALLALAILIGAAAPTGCDEGPGVPLPRDHPWYVEADDLFDDIADDPALPSLDRAECNRWRSKLRIVQAETQDEFLRWTEGYGLCPVLEGGACDPEHVGLCAAGTYATAAPRIRRRTSRFTIIVPPGATSDGFRTLIRHEAAHAAMICALDYAGHAETVLGALVFGGGGHIWRPMLPAECDDPAPAQCPDGAPCDRWPGCP